MEYLRAPGLASGSPRSAGHASTPDGPRGMDGGREASEYGDLVKGVDDGVLVESIFPDGPAAKSDLRPSDVIVKVAGHPVSTPQQLRDEVRRAVIGEPVILDVFRAGK